MNDRKMPLTTSSESALRPGRGALLWLWRWFWRVTLVVSLGYAWYCFYVPSNTVAWAGSYAAAQQDAVQSGKPLLLFFTGNWCVPCRIMKRNVWADAEVTRVVNAGFIPVTIDVDDPSAAEVLGRYGVQATPTTVVADGQGGVVRQHQGEMGKAAFLELIGEGRPTVAHAR